MQKTVKISEIIDLREIADELRGKTLPLPGAYKLTKIINNLEKDFNFYSEKFQEIVATYAQKNEDGSYKFSEDGEQILIQTDKIDECNQKLEELLDLEVTLDNLDFSIENLGENFECTPNDLEKLMPFLN